MDTEKARFVNFSERSYFSAIHNFYSDYLDEYIATLKHTKWNYFKWKGLTLMKDPMSLATYQQLLQDLKPKAILEFGTFEGGSALWMKDIMDAIGEECEIHTFDINQEQIKVSQPSNIKFHKLDNYQIKTFIQQNLTLFESLPHPLLVIEDSHVNAGELLRLLDNYLRQGDYLVVEDTFSEPKHEMMETFVRDSNYLVDTHYCDFWGYNNSWNVNSFLKKIS